MSPLEFIAVLIGMPSALLLLGPVLDRRGSWRVSSKQPG
jgi:hypothetical protein